MNILQINSDVAGGSTARIATDLSKILVNEGHQSSIAFGRGESIEDLELIRIGGKLDVTAHVL